MISIDTTSLTQDITKVTGKLGKLGKYLDELIPEAVAPVVVKLMEIYEPPKYVTRKAAYGKTFFTRRQQKWFFWALKNGMIDVPYRRTFGMREAWRIEGKGSKTVVTNDTEAVTFTMGDNTQSRHERMVGWTTTGWRLKHPGKSIYNAAVDGVKRAIKKAGL